MGTLLEMLVSTLLGTLLGMLFGTLVETLVGTLVGMLMRTLVGMLVGALFFFLQHNQSSCPPPSGVMTILVLKEEPNVP